MLGKKTSNRGRNPLVWLAPKGLRYVQYAQPVRSIYEGQIIAMCTLYSYEKSCSAPERSCTREHASSQKATGHFLSCNFNLNWPLSAWQHPQHILPTNLTLPRVSDDQ